jgi:hypothetical protein
MGSDNGFTFSDLFDVSPELVNDYGAFNISLVTDLPLFIDPFQLYGSDKEEYRELHEGIIRYLRYLRDEAASRELNQEMLSSLFRFSEVSQTWLGFSKEGNKGRGLGWAFAKALNDNMSSVFQDFGRETNPITKGRHLEKLTLFSSGVGRDMISDFTTNLIKDFLLSYTEEFARRHIRTSRCQNVWVNRAVFDYDSGVWLRKSYLLPYIDRDFVILTPADMLTKDETWICRSDMLRRFDELPNAIGDSELRENLNRHMQAKLGNRPTKEDREEALASALHLFPELMDYYIRIKEDTAEEALTVSQLGREKSEFLFIRQCGRLRTELADTTDFYSSRPKTIDEVHDRVRYLKHIIEDCGGHRLFYDGTVPIRRESDLQLYFKLTCYGTRSNVSAEGNDGRGPADFILSYGAKDKSIVEFKLASNKKLRRNLENQLPTYMKASDASDGIYVILFFTAQEESKVSDILSELSLTDNPRVVLIDGRSDNKPSASVA